MKLKETMMLYGVTLGKRYTRRQKASFLQYVMDELDKKHISYHIQDKRSSLLSVRNIIVGDVDKADTVIVAAYDTPSIVSSDKYRWYPFQPSKNKEQDKKLAFKEAILVILTLFVTVLSFWNGLSVSAFYMKVLMFLCAAVLLYFTYRFSAGKACPVSFNMNSASVAVIMDMILNERCMDRVAYILYSEGVTSVEGIKVMREVVPENKRVIVLSGLGEGNVRLAVCSSERFIPDIFKNELSDYSCHTLKVKQAEQTVLNIFPHAIILVSGEEEDNNFVIRNARTDHDHEVNMDMLEKTETGLLNYLKERK